MARLRVPAAAENSGGVFAPGTRGSGDVAHPWRGTERAHEDDAAIEQDDGAHAYRGDGNRDDNPSGGESGRCIWRVFLRSRPRFLDEPMAALVLHQEQTSQMSRATPRARRC